MITQVTLFIPIIFLCFFLLYIFSKQDFVLLRQNISLSQIFDLSLFALIFAVILGRVFSIFNDFNFELLNILAFFHLLRYPDFSTLGFFIGGAVGIFVFLKNKKGAARIFDIFSISFFPIFAFFVINQIYRARIWYLIPIISVMLLILLIVFITSHKKYTLRDGAISGIFLFFICAMTILTEFISKANHHIISVLSFTQIASIPLILASLALIFASQRK